MSFTITNTTRLLSAFLALVFTLSLFLFGCGDSVDQVNLDQQKKVAGELKQSKLYEAAITEYDKILTTAGLTDRERGNIAYLIGKIYFENLKDYDKAAAYYVRARTYDANGSYMNEVSRNLVVALEKSGKYLDAKRELTNITDINADKTPRGSVPVAIISGDTLWLEELEAQIQSLPPQIQQQLLSAEAKQEFLRQFVSMELIIKSAIREGLDRDPEFKRRKEQLVNNLLMEKYIVEKIIPTLSMEQADVRNYFEANKDIKYKDQEFEKIAQQVTQDYQTEKTNIAYMEHVADLVKIEQVLFLDQNIK